jgi:VIT1/CCC1 family predicted Fe2+/Mn2+ transporter
MSSKVAEQPADQSVGQLVGAASEQLSRLVREEMKLAVAEVQQKGKRVGIGAGLFGGAGVVALFGGMALVACAILALALVLAPWLAALVVAVLIFALAGALVLAGKSQVSRGLPPVPKESVARVEQDVEAVKEGLHR